jgi:YgiT-type zinc finger domain-containing protein
MRLAVPGRGTLDSWKRSFAGVSMHAFAQETRAKRRGVGPALSMESKDCPLCGTSMRLKTRTETVRVPGSRETRSKKVSEWICPECDYFEDAEES